MGNPRLNITLLRKMARKLRRTEQAVREGVSHRASRWRVVSEAAQVLWANELRISTGGVLATLPPHIQQQVRERSVGSTASRIAIPSERSRSRTRKPGDGLREAVNDLLTDAELRDRCADVLRGSRKYDRAVNQATLVLEARLRQLASAGKAVKAPALAAMVLNPNNKPIVRMSDDNDVQDGYFQICRGLFAVFRNLTHHDLAENFTREDAVSICGFINAFLDAIARGKRTVRTPPETAAATGS
jgi:hypothetical protein